MSQNKQQVTDGSLAETAITIMENNLRWILPQAKSFSVDFESRKVKVWFWTEKNGFGNCWKYEITENLKHLPVFSRLIGELSGKGINPVRVAQYWAGGYSGLWVEYTYNIDNPEY